MIRKLGFLLLFVGVMAFAFMSPSMYAQGHGSGRHRHPQITKAIDEDERVTLKGNTRQEANDDNDQGEVDDDLLMEHMLLQLRRPPALERDLQEFINELHDPKSPNYHKWLTAEEFGRKFGVADQDIETITRWLESNGFTVNQVYPSKMVIDFSGTAGQVRDAFQTEIHNLEVEGEQHTGNMQEPQIPAALAPAVVGVVSLHSFGPHPMYMLRKPRPSFTFGSNYGVVPEDLATIYNLNPLFRAGYSGQGQTIVVIEDTDVFSTSDWNTFRSRLGLSGYTAGSFTTVHPAPPSGTNNCNSPGVIAPNSAEAILDAEWASAAAPSAAIQLAACADTTTTFGGLIAIQNVINSSSQPPAIMSVSYGQCETVNGAAANAAYNAAYQQAVAEGVSIFVASGDSGGTGCDNNAPQATHGIGANAFASTPYNVAVGGTDFSDTFAGTNALYWNSTNTPAFGSAISYISEMPWNDSCAGDMLSRYFGYGLTYGASSLCNDPFFGPLLQTTVAGGGSPSGCAIGTPSVAGVVSGTCQGWPKPSWQSILGNPNDGVRDTPDVSLFAADGLWSHSYVFCWSDTLHGGAACTDDPSTWSGAGGTSFSAPIMAGIQASVNQKVGKRQGNPNPVYYQLAAGEYGSNGNRACDSSNGSAVDRTCVFYDVTQGDMDVNCTGNNNCYNPSGPGTQGVLSTSNDSYSPAYGTLRGWDFATGIGTLNATNLVNSWPTSGPAPNFSLSAAPNNLSLVQGASGTSTVTVNPLNGFNGSVTLTASGLPNGVSASFSSGSTATTSTLTLTASSTATTGTVSVTVTGVSGLLTHTVMISLTVTAAPDFSLSASPNTLSFMQAASGTSTITITPQNGFSSNVTLSTSGLPSGVTASFSAGSTTTTRTLTLTANSTATTGTVPFTVTGVSGTLTRTVTLSLTVTAAPVPDFSLTASPSSLSFVQGASGTSTITVKPLNGFSAAVALSASGLPSGVTASFSAGSTTTTSTLTLTATSTATTGTASVTVTGVSGTLTHTVTISLAVTAIPGSLPSGWLDVDLGSVGLAGSARYATGTFTVKGAGTSAWGTADGINFAYRSMSGDGTIVARILSVSASSTGGVMIRDSLNANAMSIFVAYYGSKIWSNYRTSTGGLTGQDGSGTVSIPYWVKLVRTGNTFSSYSSLDGVNWAQFGFNQTITMGPNVYVGLGVSSGNTASLATATFDSVSINSTAVPAPVITSVSATTGMIGSQVAISGTGFGPSQGESIVTLNGALVTINTWSDTSITVTIPAGATSGPLVVSVAPSINASNPVTFTVTSQPLPAGWLDQDVGQVGVAGNASYSTGTFTVNGAGTSLWGTADGFHFAYRVLSGNGTIVARVLSVSPSSTGGVMIRDTLNPDSTHLFPAYYGQKIYMNYRPTTGGITSQATGSNAMLPYWVKVVRSGNTLSGYNSSDGMTWVQVGTSQTIVMGPNVYIGLGVSSGSTSSLATATFDNVSITVP